MHEHAKQTPESIAPDAPERGPVSPVAPDPLPPKDAPKAGLNYVFKIAPADPKNSLAFEDVADK